MSCALRVLNFDQEVKGDPELGRFTVLFLLFVGDRIRVGWYGTTSSV